MNSMEVGSRVARLRRQHHLTQAGLALKLSCSTNLVSLWERGVRIPDHQIVENMAHLFNVPSYYILYGELDISESSLDLSGLSLYQIDLIRKIAAEFKDSSNS